MLSFRFHIVSLIAVFLALAIGILMGTTVVSRETLAQLRNQIADANRDINELRAERGDLEGQLDDQRRIMDEFVAQSFPLLVADRLAGQPVMVLAAAGVGSDPIDELQDAFASSGAVFQGTLWLNQKLTLDDEGELAEAARLAGRTTANADLVRQALLRSLADDLVQPATVGPTIDDVAPPADDDDASAAGSDDPEGEGEEDSTSPEAEEPLPVVVQMVASGFVDYQPPPGGTGDRIIPDPGTRFVLVGGEGSEVTADEVLYPLLRALAINGTVAPTVVAEGQDPEGEDGEPPEEAAPFVARVREDDVLAEQISTVDNIDDAAGQAAVVFALQQLGAGVVGHFGAAESAQRLLPAPMPSS